MTVTAHQDAVLVQATRAGQTGLGLPPATGKLPSLLDLQGTAAAASSDWTQTDSEPDSPAPRDRKKYLGILEEARGQLPLSCTIASVALSQHALLQLQARIQMPGLSA